VLLPEACAAPCCAALCCAPEAFPLLLTGLMTAAPGAGSDVEGLAAPEEL